MTKIQIDKEKCIGCGLCASICEKSFKIQGDKAIPVKKEVSKLTCEKEAADSCPVNAISLSN
jgi:ferredoxin